MDSTTPHPELRPDPRRGLVDPDPGDTQVDDEDDSALLRLIGAGATALVALAAAGSLLP
jgi:hypothetical protein